MRHGLLIIIGVAMHPASGFPAPDDAAARAVIERAIAAFGGAENYRRTLNSKITARAEAISKTTDLKIEFTLTQFTREDGARRFEKKVLGQKEIRGTDGKDAWMLLPDRSVVDLPPEAKELLHVEAQQQRILIDYGALGYEAISAPEETTDPPAFERVTFRKKKSGDAGEKPGDRFEFFFDPKSHLPAKIVFLSPDPWGGDPFLLTLRLDRYARFSEVPIATRIVHSREGNAFLEVNITGAELGVRLSDDLFRRPNPAD